MLNQNGDEPDPIVIKKLSIEKKSIKVKVPLQQLERINLYAQSELYSKTSGFGYRYNN